MKQFTIYFTYIRAKNLIKDSELVFLCIISYEKIHRWKNVFLRKVRILGSGVWWDAWEYVELGRNLGWLLSDAHARPANFRPSRDRQRAASHVVIYYFLARLRYVYRCPNGYWKGDRVSAVLFELLFELFSWKMYLYRSMLSSRLSYLIFAIANNFRQLIWMKCIRTRYRWTCEFNLRAFKGSATCKLLQIL